MPKALAEVVRVREFGVSKYGTSESWRKVDPARYLEAAQRHLMAAFAGERANPDDGGVNHLAQAVCDLLFALEIEAQPADQSLGEAQTPPTPESAPAGQPEATKSISLQLEKLLLPGETFAVGRTRGVYLSEPATAPPNAGRTFLWTDSGDHVILDPTTVDQLPTLEHMADVLARKRRWADWFEGAVSVARHCLLVASLVPDQHKGAALLHDASEALYGDRPSPLKHLERTLCAGDHPNDLLVRRFDRLLEREYGLVPGALDHEAVKDTDRVVNCWEAWERGVLLDELYGYYGKALTDRATELDFEYWDPARDKADWLNEVDKWT